MGISERKEREKAERRALIRGCAKELILERGAKAVSMMDIARRAELSKATLYLYFPSKELLFQEILREEGRRLIDSVRSRLGAAAGALEALHTLWGSFVRLFGESRDMFIILSVWDYIGPRFPFPGMEMPDTPPEGAEGDPEEFYLLVKEVIEQGIREGVFEPSINGGTVAHLIITLFSHIAGNSVRTPSYPVLGEMRNIFEIVLRGIAREGVARSALALGIEPPRAGCDWLRPGARSLGS